MYVCLFLSGGQTSRNLNKVWLALQTQPPKISPPSIRDGVLGLDIFLAAIAALYMKKFGQQMLRKIIVYAAQNHSI